MQFNFLNYQFKPSLVGLLSVLICLPLFIHLGQWQYHKAKQKQSLQQAVQAGQVAKPVRLDAHLNDVLSLQYQQVEAEGMFETRYQILLDNQVEGAEVGFHVLTPFKIDGTKFYVLVNRGWVKGMAQHAQVPQIETPKQSLKIQGMVWLPSDKIFSLEKASAETKQQAWQSVWQHLDMKKYRAQAKVELLPVVIKLNADNAAGFVRHWQLPPERAITNLSYAYQWFGFAFAAVLIFLYASVSRLTVESNDGN